ncbi:MAG: Gfo/Idh/MocA family oxidoreductase [Fidelibacterota bacterium]|nr:MAG: Gfo/Idh/MocA family oxidoreductase [Candidatus Neomarinimicrobiota bacterium]
MPKTPIITRRKFLKRATAAAAGVAGFPYLIPASALGKTGNVAPSNRIVIGVIGTGGQGMYDMRGFLNKEEAQVVAVCDVDTDHRNQARDTVNEKYGNRDCATYNDFRELIERSDIDAVLLALPDQWHAISAIMAVRAGKDVHAQKPLAYNIAEGRAIVEAVKRYDIVWQTGSQQRSDWRFRFACELVRNGRIGKVDTVKVGLPNRNHVRGDDTQPAPVPAGFDYDMWLGPAPWAPYNPGRCHWNFRWISDYSGGQITDWAGHHCDIAQWGMGTELTSPIEIEGTGVFPRASLHDTVEDYRFKCKYEEGFTMIVAGAFTQGVRFEGSDGWVFVSRSKIDAEPKSLLTSVIGPDEIHLYKSDDHQQNFLDCVRTRSRTVAPVEVAHRSIMIGHLGVIALKLGRKVEWDPQKERFINDTEADRLLSRPMRSPWHL